MKTSATVIIIGGAVVTLLDWQSGNLCLFPEPHIVSLHFSLLASAKYQSTIFQSNAKMKHWLSAIHEYRTLVPIDSVQYALKQHAESESKGMTPLTKHYIDYR